MLTTIRKILVAAFVGCVGLGMFGVGVPRMAHADEIVNVEYIVKFIKNKWDVDVPHKEEELYWAANVEYLLKVVDYVNGKLNNGEKTNYGESEYATKQAVDTVAANQAIRTLIKQKEFKPNYEAVFTFVPETTGNTYNFQIGAAGKYTIYWGDGTIQNITQSGTGYTTYTHTYSDAASNHTIGLGGKATAYSSSTSTAAIRFYNGTNTATYRIKSMDGCLGCIFSTLSSTQPRFYETFYNNTALTGPIPENLFSGITGAPVSYMFYNTFRGCGRLTGSIPENLFSGISGDPASNMFFNTFNGCSGLTGSLPENLFSEISGEPATYMFEGTFLGCSGITGPIPENLFAGIKGAPIQSMFYATFADCSGLTGTIPENLFSGISGTPAHSMFGRTFDGCTKLTGIPANLFAGLTSESANNMFYRTFYNCSSLTGPSARINGEYLYNIYEMIGISAATGGTYYNATQLEDYDNIPSRWR